MDKINPIVESESVSGVSGYSKEAERTVAQRRERTKIFSDTKSRFLLHYNDNRYFSENAMRLNSYRNCDQSPESSVPELRALHQQMILEHHQQIVEDKLSQLKSPPMKYPKQNVLYNQSIGRNRPQVEKNSTINWRSSYPQNDFSNRISFQELKEAKVNVLTNEYYTQIHKSATNNESSDGKNVKRKLSMRGHTFTYQSNEHPTVDLSSDSRMKSTAVGKIKKELLRARHNKDLLTELVAEECNPPIEVTIPDNEIQNESKSSTLNYELSNLNVDFQSMKECLRNSSSAITKFELLQSLVLRLSNQEPVERFATIQAIVDNDLFGISCKNGNVTILKDILWPVNVNTPHPLQTSAAKLLNALVSHEIGRDYFNGVSMVKLLTWRNKEEISDSMADNLIAAMKKLSLNQFQFRNMLDERLIQWLINHMKAVEFSASMFHMECMSDLLRMLMNNVENSAELASVNVPHLIVVLVRYLNVANEYVKVNIGHVLRTLLENEANVEIGIKMDLHRIIRDHIEKASNSKLKEDLQFIYELCAQFRKKNSKMLSRVYASSRCSSSAEPTYVDDRIFNSNNEHPNEKLICETDLMRKSETKIHCDDAGREEQRIQIPEQLNVGLKPCIMQLIERDNITETDGESEHSTEVVQRPDRANTIKTNRGVEIIFSKVNSRLDKSSSLLSSGSQCAASQCKQNAIDTLKMHGIEKNRTGDMDHVIKGSISSKFQSKKVHENISSLATDFSDLSAIARDPVARKEILENDSFIDELCEKVYNRLTTKLQENYFCGKNCGTKSNTNCCADGAKG